MIVERLETLQMLHSETGTFSNRLKSLEDSIQYVNEETLNQKVCVEAMEKSVVENVELMSQNMNVLDERLKSKET